MKTQYSNKADQINHNKRYQNYSNGGLDRLNDQFNGTTRKDYITKNIDVNNSYHREYDVGNSRVKEEGFDKTEKLINGGTRNVSY